MEAPNVAQGQRHQQHEDPYWECRLPGPTPESESAFSPDAQVVHMHIKV